MAPPMAFTYEHRPTDRYPHAFHYRHVNFQTWWDAYAWCGHLMGVEVASNFRWRVRTDQDAFVLRDPDDALAFRLRWC